MKRKKIRSVWKEYLTLSMRERRGLSILLSILLFQLIFLFYLNNVDLNYPYPDFDTVKKLQDEIRHEEISPLKFKSSTVIATSFSVFDPNQLTAQKWMDFGLSEKQANSVLNYLKKGGSFRTKKDVLKIYGMNDKLYTALYPYIDLPDSLVRKEHFPKKKEQFSARVVDLNKADSIALEKLKGIGPTLASRIVKYRNLLGGFITTEQLKEVWGLNDTLYQLIIPQIQISTPIEIRFLNLNIDSFPALASHPYVGKKIAGLILNYRKQHQRFNNTDELKNLPLLTDENFRKLAPYLKVD
ncbi:MAG: helix-hairpin-helix domain-containing protein [Bacteroidetes bacterium]|nr:helix-hairpin-helix domain-containing protein [Bacteroidota bacterium]MBP6335840.1 helix-hairpin-helix domain-containing protein [Bacteroidia bacterium]